MANEIKAMTIDGTRRTIKDETARNAAATAQRTANGKQDALVFDTAPTEGSTNPVTSDGIFKAIDTSEYHLPTASATTLGGVKVGDNLSMDNGVLSASQSDWDVNDETDPAYIANRPFHYEQVVDTILAETTFGPNWADYDMRSTTYDYALIDGAENVTLENDISTGENYHVKCGVSGGYEADVTAGQSTTYTLRGTGSSTKTVTGIPLVLPGYCIIVRTASKKATILLSGTASQYQVSAQTITITTDGEDVLEQIDPMFLPAATANAYGAVKVDSAISSSSANPVQNQAIKQAMDDLQSAILTAQTLLNAIGTVPIANGGTGATTAAGAASNIVDGQDLTPASVTATGKVKAATIEDSGGTLAALRESVSQIGTLVSDSVTNFNIASKTSVTVCSVNITTGKWVIIGNGNFGDSFSDEVTTSIFNGTAEIAVVRNTGYFGGSNNVSAIASVNSAATIHLSVYQDSSSAQVLRKANLMAIRIA